MVEEVQRIDPALTDGMVPEEVDLTEAEAYGEYNFAEEVRIERLAILWKITFLVALSMFWFAVIANTLSARMALWVGASIVVGVGSIATGQFVRRDKYKMAVWVYAYSIALAVAFTLYSPPSLTRSVMPYTFVLLIFVVGLMLSPTALPHLLLLSAIITLGVPALYDQAFLANHHQWAAILLTVIGALFVVQISGELYGIAEWALSNYRRERERKIQLHQSQITLQKTLARAQVLAETLEETNIDLADAKAAAEEAKNFRGQFLANMSHELRTPLNAVIGFSETMLTFPEMYDGIPLPSEYHRDLQQIHTSGAQLLHVINDILDLSKVDAGKLDVQQEKVDLMPIFGAALTTATGLVGDKPVRLNREIPDETPLVWADANRVRQILLNIYSNAAKFTEEGSITLSVDVQDEEVIVHIADTGLGIAKDEQDMIFEEFRQGQAGSRTQVQGSGLGLSISRHLVRLMNGRIWVESEVGRGSTFSFSLPRVLEVEQVPQP